MNSPIVVVSGLPRSGTSMMMAMLEAGGVELLTDGVRVSDDDNPLGYFEYEPVKQTRDDPSWLDEARGKAVKVVSPLLLHLPGLFSYRLIFMRRQLCQILASQKQMLKASRRAASPNRLPTLESRSEATDARMQSIFEDHLAEIEAWLSGRRDLASLEVEYRDVIENPRDQSERLCTFLMRPLNVDRMCSVVDADLWHQRQ